MVEVVVEVVVSRTVEAAVEVLSRTVEGTVEVISWALKVEVKLLMFGGAKLTDVN